MSNDHATQPISVPSSAAHQRRSSLASVSLGSPTQSSSMANAAASAQSGPQRGLSITTLGLSGSPTQTSPFANRHFRGGSLSSSTGSIPAYPEDSVNEDPEAAGVTPSSPFARRVSFGAQALRDVRRGSVNNGKYPSSGSYWAQPQPTTSANLSSSPSAGSVAANHKGSSSLHNDLSNTSRPQTDERVNWSESLRTRAERAPSLGNVSSNVPQNQQSLANPGRQKERAVSIATMEQPVREIPKQPKQNKPDFFQEKILRGDFMD